MLTIQQLEILLAIEQTGSLRKAADMLFLSQPALSVSIKKMEDDLGTQLFVRKSTGLELMPICNQILPIARNVVTQMKKLEIVCSEYKLLNSAGSSNSSIVMKAYPLIATTFFPVVIVPLKEYLPNLKIYTKNISMEDGLEISAKNEIIFYIEHVVEEDLESSCLHLDVNTKNCRICAIYPCINMHKDYFPQVPSVIKDTEAAELPLLTMFSDNNSAANFTGQLLQHLRTINPDLNIIDCVSKSVVKAYIDAKLGCGFGMYFHEGDHLGIHVRKMDGHYVSVPLEYNSKIRFYLSVKYANEVPDEMIHILRNILLDNIYELNLAIV